MFFCPRRLINDGADIYLDHYQLANADTLLEHCRDLAYLDHPLIEGAQSPIPRKCGIYSNVVASSCQISTQSTWQTPARELTSELDTLLLNINRQFAERFNAFVVNEYDKPENFFHAHSDKDRDNGKNCAVTISLGTTRIYQITRSSTGEVALNIPMKHGDVFVMSNNFQWIYNHAILPCELTEEELKRPCITLTTRCLLPKKDVGWQTSAKSCLVCNKRTFAKIKVCAFCYTLKKFKCSVCGVEVGAPYLCNTCFQKSKKTYSLTY